MVLELMWEARQVPHTLVDSVLSSAGADTGILQRDARHLPAGPPAHRVPVLRMRGEAGGRPHVQLHAV